MNAFETFMLFRRTLAEHVVIIHLPYVFPLRRLGESATLQYGLHGALRGFESEPFQSHPFRIFSDFCFTVTGVSTTASECTSTTTSWAHAEKSPLPECVLLHVLVLRRFMCPYSYALLFLNAFVNTRQFGAVPDTLFCRPAMPLPFAVL